MTDPETNEPREYPAIDIGKQLRKAREAAGMSVDDVAGDLRIHTRYVEALEANNFDMLNGPTYVKGYIRNYARLLEIDSVPLVEAYQEMAGEEPLVSAPPLQFRHDGSAHRKGLLTGSILVGLALLVLSGIWLFKSGYLDRYQVETEATEASGDVVAEQDSADSPPTPESAKQAASSPGELTIREQVAALNPQAASTADVPAGEPQQADSEPQKESASTPEPSSKDSIILGEDDFITAPGGEGTDELIVTFTGESWVEIKDATSYQLMHGLYKAGDIKVLLGTAPFQVFLGNAKAVQIDFNGEAVDIAARTRRNNTARFALVNQQ